MRTRIMQTPQTPSFAKADLPSHVASTNTSLGALQDYLSVEHSIGGLCAWKQNVIKHIE
jgi:hypothetical protein